jgi:hypothetical protein
MTFPLDPGLRTFQAKEAEHTLIVDPSTQPPSPAGSQAEDAEHATIAPPRAADDGAPQPS